MTESNDLPTLADLDWLLSPSPAPDVADRLAAFAPMMGSWALVVENHSPDGSVEETDAEWHFDWALGGRAVVDVWISPARASRADPDEGEWGMSVRFYDEALGRWRSTWLGPARGWVIPFQGAPTADGFQIEAEHDGVSRRWIFSDIAEQTFRWRAEERQDGGDWWVRQRFYATRTAPPRGRAEPPGR